MFNREDFVRARAKKGSWIPAVLSIILLALFLGQAIFSRASAGVEDASVALPPDRTDDSIASSKVSDFPPGLSDFDSFLFDQAGDELSRRRLEQLVDEQKFEEAAKEAAKIRDGAKRKGNETLWTWALIKEVQLRTALHGYETAVRFLKEEPWPEGPIHRDLLDLFFAQSLVTYHEAYSWEINRRERVEVKGALDLKAWTRDQIFQEAWAALMRVWKDRVRLQDSRAKDFPDFWNPGDYPAGIRETLRDSVVYLMARLLTDTDFWTPRQSNETYLLALENLLSEAPGDAESVAVLESPLSHPLEKICALLGEHENWCRRSGRAEAALEARFERYTALHNAFTQDDDRALIRKGLADFLRDWRKYPWWAVGQAILAEFTRAEDAPEALARARELAQEGVGLFPGSPGGQRCLHIVKSIEAPEYSVEIMANDAPGRRSVRVTHRNMGRVFFRAYPVDLMELIRTARDYNIFPLWDEARKILEKKEPSASWKLDLPATPDYRDHRTYAQMPASLRPGLYLVAASAREDFKRNQNQIDGFNALVGDLVLLKRDGGTSGGTEALVLSGETGGPQAGVTVDLYAFNWQMGHTRADTQVTDPQGRVYFEPRKATGPYFLLARKGDETVFDPSYLYLYGRSKPADASATLIYTDRSIYRPGQKLYWKILAYRGRRDLGQLRPASNSAASVWLEDINGQRIAEATVATNAFGTASGEFLIPAAGRPLGAWRLRASPDGSAQVRVEEYKRPTFEVTVKDPEKPLRLNRAATIKSEARYYFGLPVASGTAVWQVRREPVYPRWWWWDRTAGKTQIVAGGRSALREDGTFELTFTPRVDERKAGAESGLTYRYSLSVDITDEGGETRSASRSFRLGFVSMEAFAVPASGFFKADSSNEFTVSRSDLNGTPKPGKGSWRVVRLIQPQTALLPADQPLAEPPVRESGAKAYQTPGDRLRPRWESAPSPETILRLWKAGAEAARGAAEHDAEGWASVTVPALEAGAYRLLYETKDDFGAACRESRDFLVAAAKKSATSSSPLSLPLVLSEEHGSVPVGKTAQLFLHSGLAGQPLLLETFKDGEALGTPLARLREGRRILEIPVTRRVEGRVRRAPHGAQGPPIPHRGGPRLCALGQQGA